MLGADSWPSMVLSRATTASHHPVLNLQMFSGEATWVAVLEGRTSADDALQVAVLADSANVSVNTAPLCFTRCTLGFKKSLVAGHGVWRHSRVSDLNFSGGRSTALPRWPDAQNL
jgi:hypothetical protein